MLVLLAALTGATALWVLGRSPRTATARHRLEVVVGGDPHHRVTTGTVASSGRWLPWAASVVAALGVFAVLGGFPGAAAAVVVGVWLPRWLMRLEPRGVRRRREARQAELPLMVDLLAACLAAGATPATALQAVAGASDSTVSDDLSTASRALRAGATPSEAFRTLPADLTVLAQVFERSSRTGASVAHLLAASAEQLRADERAARLEGARRLGVKTAAPLGLCFLPGFVVLGLVPVVIGLVSSLL